MCLIPKNLHFRVYNDIQSARVATRNILVWKVLDSCTGTIGYSPYRGAKWVLGRSRTAQMRMNLRPDGKIERGLHAFMSKYAAAKRVEMMSGTSYHPAIIPVGSRIWFGMDGDVAADEMIVFENMVDLKVVYGKITKPMKYTTLTE